MKDKIDKSRINAQSPRGDGMRQRGEEFGPWVTCQTATSRRSLEDWEERSMSVGQLRSHAMLAEADAEAGGWIVRFNGAGGSPWPGDETDDELLALAKDIYPELNIVAIRVER